MRFSSYLHLIMSVTEHHIVVSRTARYYTLGVRGDAVRRIWIVVHGYGQLAERFIREFEALDDGETMIVAPEALSRFYARGGAGVVGASWMTRTDRLNEIEDYTRYLDGVYREIMGEMSGNKPELVVLGFSQGTATAARWVARGGAHACLLALWGGLLPPEHDLHASRTDAAMRIVHVVGANDTLVDRAALAAERERLSHAAIENTLMEFDGGHEIDRDALERVRQLAIG